MNTDSKIDFVIAGSAKSGTTAMTLMLDQHPGIYTSDIKETNYFIQGFEPTRHLEGLNGQRVSNNQEESDIIDTADKYSGLFHSSRSSQMLGEASPWYLLNSNVPERLLEYNNDIKVIVILRNPTNVAFANFVHQIRDRAEPASIDDLQAFFDTDRYTSANLHPFCNHLDLPKYSKHLPPYLARIPRENLYLMIYEEFLDDKVGRLNDLLSFLGLESSIDINVNKTVNVSGLPKSNMVHDAIQGSMGLKKLLRPIIPIKARRQLRSYIEALNTGSKATIPPEAQARLDSLYKEDVRYVEEVIGRPIPAWR